MSLMWFLLLVSTICVNPHLHFFEFVVCFVYAPFRLFVSFLVRSVLLKNGVTAAMMVKQRLKFEASIVAQWCNDGGAMTVP